MSVFFQVVLLSSFLVNSFSIFFSVHIIHSLLFLILVFIHAAILLLINQLEFLSLLLVIIYVGAVAILFLFIVMMLNVKHVNANWKLKGGLLAFFICIFVFQFIALQIIQENSNKEDSFFSFSNYLLDDLNNLDLFGQILYNNYLLAVLLGGFILLIAVVGSIVLTLNFNQSTNSINLNTFSLTRSKRSKIGSMYI